jgi:DNA-binding PucR family transcriptional regulator
MQFPDGVSLAVGDSRYGPDGWRLTHFEARAGLQVMLRHPSRLVRGTDVVLLAALLRDPVLATSLLETYLQPLGDGDSEAPLAKTLRTYISTGLNAASTAAILKVDRSTVQRHLRKVEDRLGRQLHTCVAELKVALEIRELQDSSRATV